jgi:exodeoxyribonuclease III
MLLIRVRCLFINISNYHYWFLDIPNSSRGLTRLGFRQEWEVTFLKYLKSLDSNKPVIWCGDLNVAHNKIDLRNPDSNTKTAGFTKEERECFTKVLNEGFIDSFRYLYPNKEFCYTYWSYFHGAREKNVGWRLDYFVLSDRIKSNLIESTMLPHFKGSDHCPVVLHMKF